MKNPLADSGRRPQRGGQVVVAAVFGALAIRLFLLTARYSVNIFFLDQWDIHDATLFAHHSLWEIFRFQHGPHRQGLGGVLSAIVEPWFHWNSRTEAFVATAIVAVAGLGMLYLKCRLFGPLRWTDAAIPMLVFTPAQWESAWNTVNFSHGTLPVLLIVLYCLAWTWRNERAKYAAITVVNFVTLYTGLGLFIGLVTPVLLLAKYRQERKTQLLVCALVSIVCLASFFIGYRNDDASGCDSLLSESPLDYLQFFCLMFAAPFGIRGLDLPSTLAGAVVMAAVAMAGVTGWKRIWRGGGASDYVMATLSSYSLLFCAATAIGRTCTGLMDAHASRYSDYKVLAVLAALFWVLGWKARWSAALPILLVPSLLITSYDSDTLLEQYRLKSGWRACYLAGKSIDVCDEENGQLYPDNERTHLQRKLDFLKARRRNLFAE